MRGFYTQKQKQFINLTIRKSLSFIGNSQFLRHENYCRGNGNRKTDWRRVSAVCDPLTGRIVSWRGQKQEAEPASGHIYDGDRTYRNAKRAESETRRNFERRVDGVQRLGTSQGFWACPICGRGVRQQWGSCSACNHAGKMMWDSGNDNGGIQNKTNSFHRDNTYAARGSGNRHSNERDMRGSKETLVRGLRNATSELLVSDNVECSSIPKQASDVDALSMSMKQEAELNSGGETQIGMLSFGDLVSDLSRDMTCENSGDSVVNRSSGFRVSDNAGQSSLPEQVCDVHPLPLTMKQGLESENSNHFGEETQNDLSSSGNAINDLDRDEICWSVNKRNLVGSTANTLNCIDWVKDLSEGNAVVVENGGLAHGFITEDVVGNETNGLEVSENSASSPTKQVEGDFSGERVVGTVENESSTHCSGKEFICVGLVGNESSEVKVSENAVQSWLPVEQNRELDKTGLSSCNDGMNALDRDGTEVSIKRVDSVGKSARWSGLDKGVKDFSRESTLRVLENSGDSVVNRSSGFRVSDNAGQSSLPEQVCDVHPLPLTMKQGLESENSNHFGGETQNDLSSSGNTINDLDRDETCWSVNKRNLAGSTANTLNCIDWVKDLSEGNAVAVENGGLAHGFITEDVAGNETNGLEVSENSASSPTKQVEGDFSGERVVGTVENESSTHCSGKEFICVGLVGNESSEVKVSENAVQSWLPVEQNRELDKTGLSSCNDGMNALDRDGTEVSIKRVDSVGKSARRSGLDKGVKDFSRESTLRVLENSGDSVVNRSSGFRVSDNAGQSSLPEQVCDVHPLPLTMKQGLESENSNHFGGETQNDLSSSGNTINDLDRDETCWSVNKRNLVGSTANTLNCIDWVKDLSEGNAVVVENGGLAHGFITEDVAGNETNGLEVSENSASSPTKQVEGDFSGERVVGTVENESSTHCSGKEFICVGLVGNESSEVKVSENAVQSWLPVEQNRELDKTGLSSCNDGMNALDRDGTEVSIKRVDSVGKSARRSGFDKGVKDFSRESTLRVLENGYGQGFSVGDVVTKKRKGKRAWVCSNCGHTEGQWWGECKVCKCAGTIKRFSVGDSGGSGDETMVPGNSARSWILSRPDEALPLRLTDVNRGINKSEWRIPLPGSLGCEVARVLGGGLVPGSLVLVGGDPGVGKSTLLLQIAAIIAEGNDIREPGPVVYVSGEESVEQIGSRADRLDIGTKELFLYSSTDIEDILGKAHLFSPRLLIVDSIQTVYLQNVTGSAGGISQVKECTSALLRYAKRTNVPVLLTGHVTKTGDIAGPRVLEHIVDVVLYLEGEKCTSHRLLRSVKNRFGSTDELGVFEMSQSGLRPVSNPSEMYLTEQHSDSEFLAGLAVAVIMDGARTFLIEIQALCSSGSKTLRHFNGVQSSRADMIISVLAKQAGLKLQEGDIFLNVVSGVKLLETAGDLALAAAICSSFLEFPIPCGVAFIGEIGLSGELRGVPRMELRLNTVAKLGYKKCIVPKSSVKSLKGIDHNEMEIIGCSNLKQVINTVFTNL